jgi:post-segregation antitoxin (ccd killing protein)
VSDSISPSDAEKLINRGISLTNDSVKANSKRKINQLSPNSVNINKEKERSKTKKWYFNNK